MAKPLAGRRAFEAKGRRACSLGSKFVIKNLPHTWPLWAKVAFMYGYVYQQPIKERQ